MHYACTIKKTRWNDVEKEKNVLWNIRDASVIPCSFIKQIGALRNIRNVVELIRMKEERWAWLGEELGFKNCIRCRGGI